MTFGMYYMLYFASGLVMNGIYMGSDEYKSFLKIKLAEMLVEERRTNPDIKLSEVEPGYFTGQIVGLLLVSALLGPVPMLVKGYKRIRGL